jgi:hypothetical protein
MSMVLAQQWISVDGFLAGANSEADVFAAVDDFSASEAHNTALLKDIDEVLLGRCSYEAFAAFWPATDEPMARQVNALPKTVHGRPMGTLVHQAGEPTSSMTILPATGPRSSRSKAATASSKR